MKAIPVPTYRAHCSTGWEPATAYAPSPDCPLVAQKQRGRARGWVVAHRRLGVIVTEDLGTREAALQAAEWMAAKHDWSYTKLPSAWTRDAVAALDVAKEASSRFGGKPPLVVWRSSEGGRA